MQTNGHNQGGGHAHDGRNGGSQDRNRNERNDHKHDHRLDHHNNAHDKAKIWRKIEDGVAKDKINSFKEELAKSQEGQPDATLHKKRRRRRRKKNRGENSGQVVSQGLSQNLSQSLPQRTEQIDKPKAQPFQQPKPVESPFAPSFEDDEEEKEEKTDEAIFEDSDDKGDVSTPFVEPAQDIVEDDVPDPWVTEPPVVPETPEVVESPLDQEVPAAPEIPEVAESPFDQEVPAALVIPEVAEAPLEPEDVPPTPPVAPINPFDFGPVEEALPPNTSVAKPINPFDQNNHKNVSHVKKEEVKPINPFDLSDPIAGMEEEKEMGMSNRVSPVEEGVYEEAESPEDTGEADEFKAINAKGLDENSGAEDDRSDRYSKPEVIEVKASDVKEKKIEPVFPEKIDSSGAEAVDYRDNFWTILEHAGITKHKMIIFGIILLAIIGVGVFFLFWGMIYDGQPVKRAAVTEKVTVGTKVQSKIITANQRPYDVISSYIFGIEYQPQDNQIQVQPISALGSISGVDAGLIFGKVVNLRQERFVEYVRLLEKMNNIYYVDIYSMLDLAVDRRATLDKYLKDMSYLIDQGAVALATVQEDLAEFSVQYTAISKQSTAYENAFLNQVKNYYGQNSYDNLQFFIDTSAQAMRIKSLHGAENILKNMFANSLAALRPRYKDIATNTEALIKGVRVFDVKGSDINAIIPVK